MNRQQRRRGGTIASAPGWAAGVEAVLRRWPGLFDRRDFERVGTIATPPGLAGVCFTAEGLGVIAFAGTLLQAGAQEIIIDAAGGGITDRTVGTVRVMALRAAVDALAVMSGVDSSPPEHRAVIATLDALAREEHGLLRDTIASVGGMPDA